MPSDSTAINGIHWCSYHDEGKKQFYGEINLFVRCISIVFYIVRWVHAE